MTQRWLPSLRRCRNGCWKPLRRVEEKTRGCIPHTYHVDGRRVWLHRQRAKQCRCGHAAPELQQIQPLEQTPCCELARNVDAVAPGMAPPQTALCRPKSGPEMQPMVQPGMTNQGHSMTNQGYSMTNQGYSMANHGCGMANHGCGMMNLTPTPHTQFFVQQGRGSCQVMPGCLLFMVGEKKQWVFTWRSAWDLVAWPCPPKSPESWNRTVVFRWMCTIIVSPRQIEKHSLTKRMIIYFFYLMRDNYRQWIITKLPDGRHQNVMTRTECDLAGDQWTPCYTQSVHSYSLLS